MSEPVKRYNPEGYTQPASRSGTGTHMVESRDGDYVLASAYDALAQRCLELEEENHRMARACAEWNEKFQRLAVRSDEAWNAVLPETIAKLDAQRERDALRAEVERLQRELATAHADASHYASSAEDMRQQAARYERLRRLNPRQFAELHQRNLAGERFDHLVDAL